MGCETKKGKLCGREECKPCFERSFASCEKSKYLKKEHGSPLLIAKKSGRKFWFECEKCRHSFEVVLHSVSNGSFCPFCSSKQLCSSDNCFTCLEKSFASSNKAKFWSGEKNKRKPREVFANSRKKFWFECRKCEHNFEMELNNVSNGQFCPFCSNQKLCASGECKICFGKSFASNEKADFWSFERNKRSPRETFTNSREKFWFECGECDHFFEMRLYDVSKGHFCPFCSNKKLCDDEDCEMCLKKSFACSDKAELWSFERNKQSPREMFANSLKKFWFECATCKHFFETRLSHASNGNFCPFCSNRKLCTSSECKTCFGKSFASSDKAEFWSFERNEQSPRDVFSHSAKKFWFECEKGHEFFSAISRISSGSWCPKCKNKTEAKMISFLEKNFKEPVHQFKASWCKNPKTNRFLPFDFCVSKTIIELDGVQHYEQVGKWKSPEEQQKTDRYKEERAVKNGYSVIRILQEDVWNDKIDWKSLLLEQVKDYETPIIKNLWE
ncbi:endonuclease [Noumeavirus]|uniref:endonuclease n=1 Tax=Noumeavirus TaxID=1955558 RepID=UPI000982BE65|nr:endonuclease [Noumeavirus]AQM73384.1 endonuclease [Noumeavirus]